ncbi:phosphorylase [Streptomyces diacarni]|uniref:Uridine phosphorylase n=1 Tax=Streptomyces diacarni TaxID=2800381 RepID=A0A367F132_9ACTN|nr:nucleoside phosphorylase [Streptomyces diacarni]RCG24088.1 phosphorylase [Streptomyces diacarni]
MRQPTFPLFPDKHTHPAAPDPAEHAAWVCSIHGHGASLSGLDGVAMVYQPRLLEYALHRYRPRVLEGWVRGQLLIVQHDGRTLGICGGFGIGAPAAVLVLEQLVALGITRVITVGTAATLQPDMIPGDTAVCNAGLRDEGVSHHYLPPGRSAIASAGLTQHLVAALRAAGVPFRLGDGWSTDAPYRETVPEITRYRTDGILTADMEAAGVFAAAAHRAIDAAAAFAIADSLIDRRPRQTQPRTFTSLCALLSASLDALSACVRASAGAHQAH